MRKKQLLATLVMLSLMHGSVYADTLTPVLTQDDSGLVLWQDGKLYVKDESGQKQELTVNTDENGYRTTTAVIEGDINGYALDYSFGFTDENDRPVDELILEFNGNVNVAYGPENHKYTEIQGSGFTVGTDTLDMTLKFQDDKTLSVGIPLGSHYGSLCLEDYGNGGHDLTILGGNLEIGLDREFKGDSKFAAIALWENYNGSVTPGVMTINNNSINITADYDYFGNDEVYVSGAENMEGTLNITTNNFNLGTDTGRLYYGFWGYYDGSQTNVTVNDSLKLYALNAGAYIHDNAVMTLQGGNALIDVSNSNGSGLKVKNNSEITSGENGINSLTINGGKYGFYAEGSSSFDMKGGYLNLNNNDYGIYLDDSQANYTYGKFELNNDVAGAYIKGSSTLTMDVNEQTVNNADYGFYAKDNSQLKISGGTLEVNADDYGVYLGKSEGTYNFNKLTLNSGEYGVYANNESTLNVTANELTVNNKPMDKNYGIYLNNTSTGTLTANSIKVENSKFGLLADNSSTLDVKNTGSYTFTNGSGEDDVAFSYLRNSKGELTIGTVDIKDAGFGFNARESSNFTFKGNNVNFINTRNAVKVDDKSNADFEVGTFTVEGGAYALAAENESEIDLAANVITVNLNDNTGDESAVYASYNSNIDVTAGEISLSGNKTIYAHGYSNYTQKAENVTLNGQVKAADGANETFSGITDEGSGILKISTSDSDAVTAYSYVYVPSTIEFNQLTFINSQGDEEYHADKQGVRTNSAIRANRNSVINLDKAASIYGDIIAGKGKIEEENVGDNDVNLDELSGGKITINSVEGAEFKGDVLAGNSGEITLTLNGASYEGRVDDYADASLKGIVFRPEEFDVDVTEGGTVNMTLNNSTWTARGQSFVTDLTLDNGIVDMTGDLQSSVTVNNLSGDGTIKMNLDSLNRENGDMLYVTGTHSGNQTIYVNWINGSDVYDIGEGERVRFATTDGNSAAAFSAQTRDAGFFNLEYLTDTDEYDANEEKAENIDYNGVTVDSEDNIDKPGNDFVDSVFDNGGINHYIVGVGEQTVSDAGKTIINMSKVNYNNAIYMDRLNKRLGEARYINPEDEQGMWVRIRHDRIGKDDAFRSQNTMYEMGYDEKQECDNGERRVGFAIDYMDGKAEYTGIAGSGDVKRYGLWLYDTWMGDKGHYADYVAKWGHLKNDFDIMARSTGEKINGDYSNNVFSVSAEYGRKKDIGNDWYVEPQAQLQLARVTGADYTTSQGTRVSLDGINSLIGRAGFRLGRDVDERSTVYVKADLLHEFLGEQDMHVVDNTFNGSQTFENKGTWYDVGFGFATALGKDSYAFMDFEKSFGNDNDETYQINAGVQWTF